ncbi:DNA-3-methyladenine glycosylase family protein [Gracilibacillus timonensis]|uniref:DNA-3-methyladenine glycosylase family protein n=1 Tax=Gracilibacillus timonensis TaxID=1816696 RepID=UPI0008266997|nr:DNA-3-methyladenine glycosylase [Gracilibacillus timonensis]
MKYNVAGVLYPSAPFDFEKSISFLQSFKPTNNEQTYQGHRLTKAIELSSIRVIFSVYSTGTIQNPILQYELYANDPISSSSQAEAEDRITFFLSLKDDLTEFYARSERDNIFSPIMKQLYGYHQVKFLTPFENACWAVLSIRNPMKHAINLKKAFMQTYGDKLYLDNTTYFTFPSPQKLITINEDSLNNIVHNQTKANYLWHVIQAFYHMDEMALRSASYQEAYNQLIDIKGIGKWSADFILLRGLGKMEKLPFNEKVLNKSFEVLYSQAASKITLGEISRHYGKFVGYWAHYMRVAQNGSETTSSEGF